MNNTQKEACLYADAMFRQHLESLVLTQRQAAAQAYVDFADACNPDTATKLDMARQKLHIITKHLNTYRGIS